MRKRFGFLLALLGILGVLAGCGKKNDSTEILLKDVNVERIVTLGEYKGLKVQVESTEVDEAELKAEIDDLYMQALSYMTGVKVDNGITDRAVENGDIVNIDYVGKKDGVAFSGGTSEGAYLAIGSGTFISGFEEGLVGVTPGSEVDLNLTFPENYHSEELAGAQVVFTVKVNYILPEKYNDTLIAELGIPDVTTYEELLAYYRSYMESQIASDIEDKVLSALVASCEFKELPEKLVEKYRNLAKQNIEATAAMYGVTADTYTNYYYGVDLDTLLEDISITVKENLALQAVANKEKLNISDEELEKELLENAVQAGYDTIEEYIGATSREDFREYLMLNNVTNFLVENAVVEKAVN